MALITECMPCQVGDHDHHHRVVQAVPEGVLGGAICPCEGECRQRAGKTIKAKHGGLLPRSLQAFDDLIASMTGSASDEDRS